jgi:hypothetical protein
MTPNGIPIFDFTTLRVSLVIDSASAIAEGPIMTAIGDICINNCTEQDAIGIAN